MDDSGGPSDDTDLRNRILAGLAAAADLESRFRKPLERFLVGMCDSADGRSREKAVEIASQTLAECFTRSPSLLEKWQGRDNLEAFLRTAAANKLKTWWSSAEKRTTEVNSDSHLLAGPARALTVIDREQSEMALQALRAGMEAAGRECPEGLVFLRLKGLFGVDQRVISRCWGHHEAQTSRRIREAMDLIRTAAVAKSADLGGELSMDSLQQALQRDPWILLAGDDSPGAAADSELLRILAAGNADAATRHQAVDAMSRHPRLLAFFAQMLNRENARDALIVRDPALSGMAARVAECLRGTLGILQPSEAAGLITPLMAACFTDLLARTGADGGTLWLLCPGDAALEAVYNPTEPEIAGKRQPLVSGIVSLVLATGEPACVSGVAGHERHSPAIDMALGKTTRAMIAVPFVLAGTVRGVLTVVRLSGDTAFEPEQSDIVVRYSEILSGLMTRGLTERILE